jgi:hypothetical protein
MSSFNYTLHEAMAIILDECPNKSATTVFLSDEISKRNLYKQKTGGIAHSVQIFLRARRYPDLFELEGNKVIRLRTSSSDTSQVLESKLSYYEDGINNDINIIFTHLRKEAQPFLQIKEFSQEPGLYAIYFYGEQFPIKEAAEYIKIRPIIYLGKTATSSFDRDLKQHFTSGETGRSTLRRSLGALLREQLDLHPIPRGNFENSGRRFRNYKFDSVGENRLTEWMKMNLGLSFYPVGNDLSQIRYLEKKLINKIVPVLNLANNFSNIFYQQVEDARNDCVILAKETVN